MQDEVSLVGRQTEIQDVADAHRWCAYTRFFKLEPVEPTPTLHWTLFTGLPEATREDGHAAVMAPFPPLSWPRRMWAGGELKWISRIAPADALMRRSTVMRADRKQGTNGEFLLTSLEHLVLRGGRPCVVERQDVVFLSAATAPTAPTVHPLSFTPDWQREISFGPVDLFRYSALTLNSHRIHYDASYARDVEHYPALVVHGPLLASTMIHAGVRAGKGALPVRFVYRAVAPTFVDEQLRLVGRINGTKLELAVVGPDDGVRTTGRLELKETA